MYENFDRIAKMVSDDIDGGGIAGASVAVFHKGKQVYNGNFGYADKEKGVPMSDNTMFRMFSMTKPVTACAAMILMEQGKISFNDPLKWYLPTFENPQVLDEKGTRPADRDILLKDLMSMTSGICYPEDSPAGRKMGEVWWRVSTEQAEKGYSLSTHDFALEMGKIPLAFTPGERWMYGASADIMGAVIEVCSGMKLSEFMEKEIFAPLGMKDTGFYIPAEKYDRLATCYYYDDKQGCLAPFTEPQLCLTEYRTPPSFESGGAGLVSTIADYGRFGMMLANGGELEGVRILGRKTVDFMTENMLTEKQKASLEWDSMRGYGYGNLMRILENRSNAACNASLGEFGWGGWTGNFFMADRTENLVFLYFIQRAGAGTTPLALRLKNTVNSAIND
ncbi:MAG: beta-lactamase family protein [Oscillospiraceae bacterium]|nr:beta-lactamase family protein [Oscillospiraceae bacterium]